MDPTEVALQTIDGLEAAANWAGVEQALREALVRIMGGLQRVREVPLIPRPTWDTCVGRLRMGDGAAARELTPVEAARVESFRRVCFLRVGRPTDSPGDAAAGGPAVPGAPFPPAGGGPGAGGGVAGARKLKLSAILDPTLDADIQGLSTDEVTRCYNTYKTRYGDFPSPEADVSADQLGALHQVLQSGSVPFADFSVFGPFGTRRLRKQTFTGYHLNVATGEWSKRELPGPGVFHSWYQTWKCYRTGLLLLEAAQAEHLDAYSEYIRGQVTQFGEDAWWLIYRADHRMRSEHLERVRRNLRATPAHGYTELTPWSACYCAAVKDADFWQRELATPATLWLARNKRESGEGQQVVNPDKKRKTRANRRTTGEDKSVKGEDGIFTLNRKGLEICTSYNVGKCGTPAAQGRCRHQRSHQCNKCLGPHMATKCQKGDRKPN